MELCIYLGTPPPPVPPLKLVNSRKFLSTPDLDSSRDDEQRERDRENKENDQNGQVINSGGGVSIKGTPGDQERERKREKGSVSDTCILSDDERAGVGLSGHLFTLPSTSRNHLFALKSPVLFRATRVIWAIWVIYFGLLALF